MKSAPAENRESRVVPRPSTATLPVPLGAVRLTNGRYHVQLNATGSGRSECDGISVTRWTRDETLDVDGFHIYLRDLDDGFFWSVGHQPTHVQPVAYEWQFDDRIAEIRRVDCDIESCLSVIVPTDLDCELRRCRLTNLGGQTRAIELTSYVELALNTLGADAHHPAFSKLFVETQWCEETNTIVAKRRLRGLHESEIGSFHALLDRNAAGGPGAVEFETNRKCFIGRGRTLARPQALDLGQHLTGDSGPVLDPIAGLRTIMRLAPGETRDVVFALGMGQDRENIETMLAAIAGDPFEFPAPERIAHKSFSSNGEVIYDRPSHNSVASKRRSMVHAPHPAPVESVASAADRAKVFPTPGNGQSARPLSELSEPLLFDNGYGGFSPDGREYVIRLRVGDDGFLNRPPQPWCNVIANRLGGFLVSESGAGHTWAGNSRLNRLTAWHNDPVCDPHSEAFWIRDEDAGVFWSIAPGPSLAPVEYEVRHGFGYTKFRNECHELEQELTLFMAADQPVKLAQIRLVNWSQRARKLSLFSYVHWALGGLAAETSGAVRTHYENGLNAMLATNPQREEYGGCVAFSAPVIAEATRPARISHSANRATFLGSKGLAAPDAIVATASLDSQTGDQLDPCAAWQVSLELAPGETLECAFLLGEAPSHEAAAAIIRDYQDLTRVQHALETAKSRWEKLLSAITIETPDREIDLMVNGWLMYQNLSCRIWGRSAYYQPGGAFGFRDQLQDVAALVYHAPELTRRQIVLHASQQFLEGDVLHWWHPDTGYGLRTRFSDDLLWLPLIAAEYVRTTGDVAVLDEVTPYLAANPLTPDEQEKYLRPKPAGQSATVYEHCCRALDRGMTTGSHGLPLIGCGDWNDGMNRVGCAGRGESVWLGFFICHVLDSMLPICRERSDRSRVERYEAYREQLAESLNAAGWDGAWYRRAYYDNGQVVGSAASDECQIDAIAQAWAVISGVAPDGRAALALSAVEQRLVDEQAGMIRLLTPPFDKTANDPGYIKGYLPGIRENGGQYTHGVLWVVRAMAEMGRGSRAIELLRLLSPVSHTRTAEDVAIYQTEPYVVAADVYGEPPHVGRGGWTWYTGSAGWMFRVAIESIFGMTLERGQTLVLNPCISRNWPQAKLRYRLPDGKTNYCVTIENPARHERGIQSAVVDGTPLAIENGTARVPLVFDGGEHTVILRL